MAKFPLDWHRNCLANMRRTLEREGAALLRMQDSVAKFRERVAHTGAQIAEAERRGLDGFDSERPLAKGRA